MKKWISILLGFLLLLIIVPLIIFYYSYCGVSPLSCGSYETNENSRTQKINVGSGPEDMAIDSSAGLMRIIVSCADRRDDGEQKNGFYSIDLIDDQVKKLTIIPSEMEIHPHGIDVVGIGDQTFLYAISHDGPSDDRRHSIYRFEIHGDTLRLDSDHVLSDDLMTGPNDLDVLEDGSFYVSNPMPSDDPMESTKSILGIKNGNVIHYDGKGSWSLAIENLCYPNGVWVNQKDGYLFVANGGCQEINRYKLAKTGIEKDNHISTRQHDIKIPIGDNLLMDHEGVLWTASHPCPLKFLNHAKDPDNKSPMQVYAIDPMTLKSNMVFQNEGDLISAASTVMHINDKLYISQVFDPFVLVVENWTD